MLLFLWNKLQEAFVQGRSELRLLVVRGGGQTRIMVGDHQKEVNVSDEIPELSLGGEAVAVYDRLRQEGYLHVDYFGMDPMEALRQAALTGLSTRGLIDIGKFPDPDERMARAFEEARGLVANDPSIPPDKKAEALDTMLKMIGLFNSTVGLGERVTRALGPHHGGGS
jgi:hypothetical protein